MSGFSSNFPPGSIKLIQRGTVTIADGLSSGTATITAVNTAKSILTYLGVDTDQKEAYLEFTNATTITAKRSGTVTAIKVGFEVTEYY